MPIKGKDFAIYILQDGDYKPICHATDCIINQDVEMRRISTGQGPWRDYIGGDMGYTISVPGLVEWRHEMNFLQLEKIKNNRTKVPWMASDSENGGVQHSGILIIDTLNLTTQMRDTAKFDMTAMGCGPKATDLLPIAGTVYLADNLGVRLPGCPNPYPVTLFWYDGTMIGIANNADDVITVYNSYAGNEYYELTGSTTGCDFNILIDWDAPFKPTFIIAEPTPNLGMWTGNDDDGISNDQVNDNLISPIYA